MKDIISKPAFLKDWKKLEKKHYNKQELLTVIHLLSDDTPLPGKYHDHALVGDMKGYRECHIRPNWLLIYQTTKTEVILVATGSHDDLFR